MKIVLGIDGGGTHTRVAITDTEGSLLSYVNWKGGANAHKDPAAKENVCRAINQALNIAGCRHNNIIGLAAGIAGYDKESDLTWVRELTNIDGLHCPIRHVNDAIVANAGAFLFKPGIIAISGTGSIVYGITEKARHIRNYDFGPYLSTAARFLSFEAVQRIIIGEINHTDTNLMNTVFKYFGVTDVPSLADAYLKSCAETKVRRDKIFGDLAPEITNVIAQGSQLAEKICVITAANIVSGIKLVGAFFESDSVLVALVGAVANSDFIANKVAELLLEEGNNRQYILVKPAVPPVLGAAIIAMRVAGLELDGRVLANICNGIIS